MKRSQMKRSSRQVTDFIMKGASAEISREVGGAFSIFGGVIVGRHIELVPYERIVQAWREKDWDPGLYSIVRFQLNEQGTRNETCFRSHRFPPGSSCAPGAWMVVALLGAAAEISWYETAARRTVKRRRKSILCPIWDGNLHLPVAWV